MASISCHRERPKVAFGDHDDSRKGRPYDKDRTLGTMILIPHNEHTLLASALPHLRRCTFREGSGTLPKPIDTRISCHQRGQ